MRLGCCFSHLQPWKPGKCLKIDVSQKEKDTSLFKVKKSRNQSFDASLYIYILACMYIYKYIHIPAPSNGWCWNPKGLLNDTLSHPFGTPWRVQVYDLVWISCGEVVKREACRKFDACISLYLLYICSYHPSKQTASNRNSARSHGQEGVKQRHQSTTGTFLVPFQTCRKWYWYCVVASFASSATSYLSCIFL